MESFTQRDISEAAGRGRVAGIDGARALAMTAVVAEHSGLMSFGWVGVWLFYVISGFVVTGSLATAPVASSTLRFLRAFYVRRFARILPPYYLLVVIAVLISLMNRAPIPAPTLGSFAFFFNNIALAKGWGELKGFNLGNLWTVSVEMQFYALYGVAFAFFPRRHLVIGLAALLLACPVIRFGWGALMAMHGTPRLAAAFDIYSSSLPQFDAFAAGCLLALHRDSITSRTATYLVALGIGLLALYCAVYLRINVAAGAHGVAAAKNLISGILFGEHREAFVYVPIVIISAGLISKISVRAPVERLLSWRPLVFAGEISYGAYLYHIAALNVAHAVLARAPLHHVNRFVVRGASFGLGMALTLLAAAVSFYAFERPIVRAVGRHLRRQHRMDSTPSPA